MIAILNNQGVCYELLSNEEQYVEYGNLMRSSGLNPDKFKKVQVASLEELQHEMDECTEKYMTKENT